MAHSLVEMVGALLGKELPLEDPRPITIPNPVRFERFREDGSAALTIRTSTINEDGSVVSVTRRFRDADLLAMKSEQPILRALAADAVSVHERAAELRDGRWVAEVFGPSAEGCMNAVRELLGPDWSVRVFRRPDHGLIVAKLNEAASADGPTAFARLDPEATPADADGIVLALREGMASALGL